MKVISFLTSLFFVMTLMMGQNFKVVAANSLDCTGGSKEFVVPDGKTIKLTKMDIIVPSWASCNQSEPAPVQVYAQVVSKSTNPKVKPTIYYKMTVKPNGDKSESKPIQDVKLMPGTYVLEISRAPKAEVVLEYFMANN
ncbi:MAG: hypothetical protein N2Z72_06670 [Bacteroidales bacterium]|nr:hypothetical protein [Bacteroidales bacterium]